MDDIRVAIYARVSTADGRQDPHNQIDELRSFARKQSWRVVSEYVDTESGGTASRPRFQELLEDAARLRFDAVLFWSLDRFSREGAFETLRHLDRLSASGVGFRSLTEPFLDSCGPFRDAIIAFLGAIAKQERQRVRERVHAGLERARRQGTRSGKAIGRPKVMLDRVHVTELRLQGISWREIARKMGVGVGTVRRAFWATQTAFAACQNTVPDRQ